MSIYRGGLTLLLRGEKRRNSTTCARKLPGCPWKNLVFQNKNLDTENIIFMIFVPQSLSTQILASCALSKPQEQKSRAWHSSDLS